MEAALTRPVPDLGEEVVEPLSATVLPAERRAASRLAGSPRPLTGASPVPLPAVPASPLGAVALFAASARSTTHCGASAIPTSHGVRPSSHTYCSPLAWRLGGATTKPASALTSSFDPSHPKRLTEFLIVMPGGGRR